MSQETNDGSPHWDGFEASDRLTIGSANGPACEPAQIPDTTTAQNSESFDVAPKRRKPRWQCGGSAEVREHGCAVKAWRVATIAAFPGGHVDAQAAYFEETSENNNIPRKQLLASLARGPN